MRKKLKHNLDSQAGEQSGIFIYWKRSLNIAFSWEVAGDIDGSHLVWQPQWQYSNRNLNLPFNWPLALEGDMTNEKHMTIRRGVW